MPKAKTKPEKIPEHTASEVSQPKVKKSSFLKVLFMAACLTVLAGALYFGKALFVAALVNNYPISRLSLIRELESQGGKSVLENLIDKSLILQEANRSRVKIEQSTVDAEIKKIEEQLKSQGLSLDEALASRGQTKATLIDQIRLQKTVEAILAPKIVILDSDIKKYYDGNKSIFGKDQKFEDLKEKIREQLTSDKLGTEYRTWIADLRAKANIKYFLKF